jgi:hypothetical protein
MQFWKQGWIRTPILFAFGYAIGRFLACLFPGSPP